MRALVLALLLVGCGGGVPVCGDDDLQGSWQGNPVQGTFDRVTLVFGAGGAYTVYLNDTAFHGHYSWDATASQFTILDDDTCQGAGAAVYALDIDPDSMCRDAIVHYVSDPCTDRITTLNGMHIAKY